MSTETNIIKENIKSVNERVKAAAERSGRKLEDICVIAVTKTVDTGRMMEAVNENILNLGENKVQELREKYDIIKAESNGRDIKWHLIGHLQTNKVKYIIDKVSLIHSLDSLELAQEIDKRSGTAGRVMEVLVQVNVAQEETKFGISPGETMDFVKKLAAFKNLKVKGLMTVAPVAEDPEGIRWVFNKLNKIFIDIKKENIDNIDMAILSMGMSNDFEVAIEEGANMIRVGSSIFGKRNYQV